MSSKKQEGFSLIELMVVVSIMAILAVIGLGGFANAQKKARDSRRKADIKTIQNSMISSADIGGNMDANAARAEMGGKMPEDPRRTGGVPDQYLLVAPLNQTTTADQPTVITELQKEIVFIDANSADGFGAGKSYNSGLACSVVEAPNTGNVKDDRVTTLVNGDAVAPFKAADFAGAEITTKIGVGLNGAGGITLNPDSESADGRDNPALSIPNVLGSIVSELTPQAKAQTTYTDLSIFCATF